MGDDELWTGQENGVFKGRDGSNWDLLRNSRKSLGSKGKKERANRGLSSC